MSALRSSLLSIYTAALMTLGLVQGKTAYAQEVPADVPNLTLKVAVSWPSVGFVADMIKSWTDNVTKKTDGKIKFQMFWSESLFKVPDAATSLAAGVADFSNVAATYDPAKTPLWMTLDMPFNARDYWCGIDASVKTAQDEPNLKQSFQNLGFMPVVGFSSGHFYFVSRTPVEKLADLQKKRIRSYGGARIKMYEPLNIAPIFMPYGQIYEALERGVIDGAEGTVLLTDAFRHYEIAKFITETRSGTALSGPISVSLKRWNTFPESLKKIFFQAGIEHDQLFAQRMMQIEETKLKEFSERHNMKVLKLPAAEQAAMEKAGAQAQEAWIVDMEKKNVPARATWNYFKGLVNTCEKNVASNGYPWKK